MIFSGRHALKKDSQENYFLDRDGVLFNHIIDFLRDEKFQKPSDPLEEALLRAEFDYFRLPYPDSGASSSLSSDDSTMKRKKSSKSSRKKAAQQRKNQAQQQRPEQSEPINENRAEDDLHRVLDEREKLIRAMEAQYEEQVEAIENEQEMIEEVNSWADQIISLNVGGIKLKTTRSCLCSIKDSMLNSMFAADSRHTLVKDRNGNVFLDRDGGRFRQVLNYLRNLTAGVPVPPATPALEAEFEKLCIVLPEDVVSFASSSVVLDPATFKGSSGVLSLSADGKAFTKTASGHCAISSNAPLPIGSPIRIKYVSITDPQGWLAVGVHLHPATATQNSYIDAGFYGVNFTKTGNTNNGSFIAGKWHSDGNLQVREGSTITVTLSPSRITISCDFPSLSRDISLPQGNDSNWFLHFNPHSASFQILN